MANLLHDFYIAEAPERVFEAVSTPKQLDAWWTKRSAGNPENGGEYEWWFGPEFDWRAVVVASNPPQHFEWRITTADEDWTGTTLGFRLIEQEGGTHVRFYHTGWPKVNDHFRTTSFCWAMYLRLLKRYVETGEIVPYENRLEV